MIPDNTIVHNPAKQRVRLTQICNIWIAAAFQNCRLARVFSFLTNTWGAVFGNKDGFKDFIQVLIAGADPGL